MNMNAVAKRISDSRKAKGLTQEALAAMADVSSAHIGIIERAVKVPNLATFVSIANALGVSADYLLQDVIDQNGETDTAELMQLISKQPPGMRRKLIAAVRALTEEDESELMY
jgi:transcriptional regulator with XRE-family HTH domain